MQYLHSVVMQPMSSLERLSPSAGGPAKAYLQLLHKVVVWHFVSTTPLAAEPSIALG
jgi:hypothetical protein